MVSTRGTTSRTPQSFVAPNGNAMVIWPTDQFEARRYIAGSGWESATTVLATTGPGNPVPEWRGLTADAAENWTVLWSETDVGLWSRRRTAASDWQAAVLIGLWASMYDPASGAWSTPVRVEDCDEDVLGYASSRKVWPDTPHRPSRRQSDGVSSLPSQRPPSPTSEIQWV